jgi:hypothetical protein
MLLVPQIIWNEEVYTGKQAEKITAGLKTSV